MPQPIKVEWFKISSSLNEIYQSTGIMFAFSSSPVNGFHQCHEWVKCRDFLPDAIRSQLTNKIYKVYGFIFDPDKNPKIDLNKMRMFVTKALRNKEEVVKFKQKIKASLKLLHHFENIAKVGKTEILEVDTAGQTKYKSIYLFIGSVMWLRSPFLISLYTFLIRLGDKEFQFTNNTELKAEFKKLADRQKSGKIADNDAYYLTNSWNKLDLIIKNRSKLFPTEKRVHDFYWKEYSMNTFHNNTGINSLVKYLTPYKVLNTKIKLLH